MFEWWRDDVCKLHTVYRDDILYSTSKESSDFLRILDIVTHNLGITFMACDFCGRIFSYDTQLGNGFPDIRLACKNYASDNATSVLEVIGHTMNHSTHDPLPHDAPSSPSEEDLIALMFPSSP